MGTERYAHWIEANGFMGGVMVDDEGTVRLDGPSPEEATCHLSSVVEQRFRNTDAERLTRLELCERIALREAEVRGLRRLLEQERARWREVPTVPGLPDVDGAAERIAAVLRDELRSLMGRR